MKITRRHAVAGFAAVPFFGPLTAAAARRVRGANEDLRVGVIGLRSRGQDHMAGLHRAKGARVVALCDVDRDILDSRAADFEKKNQVKPQTFSDVRELLARDDIDAVSIATPNHWHSLMGIWAMQTGKHVYVEKPVSHDVREGEQLVRAAERYGRVAQCGTQSRSNPGLREAMAFLREGGLGRIRLARGLCYKPRPSIGKTKGEQPVPASVDYELWCGPAAKEPLRRRSLHYDWHWVWSTGNGDLGNQGIHQMDICRWALGEDTLPRATTAWGGRVGYDDDGETPNTMVTVHDYPTAPLVFEVRGLPSGRGKKEMDKFLGASIGCVIHCDDGWMSIPSYDTALVYDRDGKRVREFKGSADHYQNFVDAVHAQDASLLNAPIKGGHLSSALCHLGNISVSLGAAAEPAAIRDALAADTAAAEAHARMREHLVANDVDLGATPLALGPRLDIDTSSGQFTGVHAQAAETLARGVHRAPFVLPEF